MKNFLLFIFCLWIIPSWSQVNPSKISKKILVGQDYSVDLFTSSGTPVQNSAYATGTNRPDKNTYTFFFNADTEGRFTHVIKYEEGRRHFYTTIEIEVVSSLIETKIDYVELNSGTSTVLDVLANDISSSGDLTLSSILHTEDCKAEIVGNEIQITADNDFTGLAYVNYLANNSEGASEIGNVSIKVIGIGKEITDYFVHTGEKIDIVLSSSLESANGQTLGKIAINDLGILTYSAGTREGIDELSIVEGGQLKQIKVHVLSAQSLSGVIRDDEIRAQPGQEIRFDVLENDLEKDLAIIAYSPQLKRTSPSSGTFIYNVPSNTLGEKIFTYTVDNEGNSEVGKIRIIVEDFLPESKTYEFVGRKNTPFVIDFPKEVGAGSFNFVRAPNNGDLVIKEGGLSNECSQVDRASLLVYNPNTDYVGTDYFKIEYCNTQGICTPIDVSMVVVESNEDCNCIGHNCVWAGDVNRDGRVGVDDLLPIGYYFGTKGQARQESTNEWNALVASDWGEDMLGSSFDIKNADTNGDGLIDANDITGININYSKENALTEARAITIKDIPFYAVPRQDNYKAGDMAIIDLYVGNSSLPLFQSHGITFGFNMPKSFIKEGSLNFSFDPNSWFGYNNPTVEIIQTNGNGGIEGAISLVGQEASSSGFGLVGSFNMIIFADQDGLKPNGNDKVQIPFTLGGGQVIEGNQQFDLEAYESFINLDLGNNSDTEIKAEKVEVVVYPNPASNQVTIHANNNDEIVNITLMDVLGRELFKTSLIDGNHYVMSMGNYSNGMYLIRTETKKGVSAKKLQVLK